MKSKTGTRTSRNAVPLTPTPIAPVEPLVEPEVVPAANPIVHWVPLAGGVSIFMLMFAIALWAVFGWWGIIWAGGALFVLAIFAGAVYLVRS